MMKINTNEPWKGKISSVKILDESYPVDFGDFTPIPKDKQPVVAGIFCHSFFIDEKGNCTFDRLNDIQMTSPPMLISSSHKRENKENDISNMQKIDKLIDKNSSKNVGVFIPYCIFQRNVSIS